MRHHLTFLDPGNPRRECPLLDQLEVARDAPDRWIDIAMYDTRGSATAVVSRLRRRMGDGDPALELTTRLLDDGKVHVFARWVHRGAQES